MDDKLRELCAAFVAVATVPHEELGQVEEVLDGKVGRQTGLPPLLADNADAHVRGLDHGDIVAAVANAAHPLPSVLLDQRGDLGLLGG